MMSAHSRRRWRSLPGRRDPQCLECTHEEHGDYGEEGRLATSGLVMRANFLGIDVHFLPLCHLRFLFTFPEHYHCNSTITTLFRGGENNA